MWKMTAIGPAFHRRSVAAVVLRPLLPRRLLGGARHRSRGRLSVVAEGWEWVRIQTDACPQCGHNPARTPVHSLGGEGIESATDWGQFLSGVDQGYLRTSPAPGVWSPIQYAAHVRDMLRVFGDRILLAVEEDSPIVPWFDPSEEEWDRYNKLDPGDVASDVAVQADRLAAILEDRRDQDWDRTAVRDGVDHFTVAGMACFAVHEAHHHLLDA
ncbi:MAG: hypothetical protein AUI36_04535, partial [Cyanobacteria bacterium 13_1_40CM_2_61_4]